MYDDACGLSQQRPFLKVASSLVFQKRMEEALPKCWWRRGPLPLRDRET